QSVAIVLYSFPVLRMAVGTATCTTGALRPILRMLSVSPRCISSGRRPALTKADLNWKRQAKTFRRFAAAPDWTSSTLIRRKRFCLRLKESEESKLPLNRIVGSIWAEPIGRLIYLD